jgi:hypothetical protein
LRRFTSARSQGESPRRLGMTSTQASGEEQDWDERRE